MRNALCVCVLAMLGKLAFLTPPDKHPTRTTIPTALSPHPAQIARVLAHPSCI